MVDDDSLGEADYYRTVDYAGLGQRILVLVIDFFVILLFGIGLWIPFAMLIVVGNIQVDPTRPYYLAYYAAVWVYLAPIRRTWGTLGYFILGLKIVSANGGPPSLFRMTLRMAIWILGPLNFILDLLWLSVDTECQSLRDCYLSTYVVKKRAAPIGSAPAHLSRYFAFGWAFAYPRVCRPTEE